VHIDDKYEHEIKTHIKSEILHTYVKADLKVLKKNALLKKKADREKKQKELNNTNFEVIKDYPLIKEFEEQT